MSSQSPLRNSSANWDDLVFDGTYCASFIRSVKSHARNAGMLHDNYGIADMVSLSFVGDALVWFTQLDSEVAQDWSLLERALLEKYHDSSNGVSVSPSILIPYQVAVAPPPAASGVFSPAATVRTRGLPSSLPVPFLSGRLRLHVEGRHTGQYVSRFTYFNGKNMQATNVPEDAAIIGSPSAEQHVLEILNPNSRALWFGSTVLERDVSPSLKLVVSLVAEADAQVKPLRSGIATSKLARTGVWDISRFNNSLKLTWELDGNTYSLGAMLSQTTDKILFASDRAACIRHHASEGPWRRAEIIFEPVS